MLTNRQAERKTTFRQSGSAIASHVKWKVAFNCGGKNHFVGYFDDEIGAARAYNEAARERAGEFARLNEV